MAPWSFFLLVGNLFVFGCSECPRIITRVEWGARSPFETPETLKSTPSFVVVHHGGRKKYCDTQEQCAQQVRSYQKFHMNTRGWNDIGYNFLVGEDGNVYEGRGWDAVGAHAPKFNSLSIGICVIGDFSDRLPNDEALSALKLLIQCGVETNKIQSSYKLMGHRQSPYSLTECPGRTLYEEITSWSHWTPHLVVEEDEALVPIDLDNPKDPNDPFA